MVDHGGNTWDELHPFCRPHGERPTCELCAKDDLLLTFQLGNSSRILYHVATRR